MHFSTVTIALLTGSAMASHLVIRVPEPYSPRLVARQGGCSAVQGLLQSKGLNCCSNDGTSYLVCPPTHSHCTTGDNKAWCCPSNQQDCPRKACSDNNGGCDPNQYTCDDNKGCVPKDYSKVMEMFAAAPQQAPPQAQDAATSAANSVSAAVVGAAGDASAAATSAAGEASQAVVDAASSASSAVAEATTTATDATATTTTTASATTTQETAPAATGAASTLGGVSSLVVAIMAVVFIL